MSLQKNAFRSSRSHERYLWIVYDDKKSNFNELLAIRHQNLQNWQLKCLKFLEVEVLKLLMNYLYLERKHLMK